MNLPHPTLDLHPVVCFPAHMANHEHPRTAIGLSALSIALAVALLARPAASDDPKATMQKVGPPPAGRLYHAVYPGGESGEEDDFTVKDLRSYEETVGRKAAWVYLSNNWYQSRAFPKAMAEWVRATGAAPFVRLMLRSDSEQGHAEPLFTVSAIVEGKFDDDLKAWGRAAKEFGTPLLAEWGTECNGEWFSWNGKWNGADEMKGFGDPKKPDGPERFAAAYRHIVETIRGEGALNVTWVWHVDANDAPGEDWNRLENYYPGDDVVDWIGISAYGPQTPAAEECDLFSDMMDACVPRLEKLAAGKPLVVLEFGCTAGSPAAKPEEWAGAALDDLLAHRWKSVIGFSWWNEKWENDDDPAHNTTMRVQDTPALAKVFREKLAAAKGGVVERPASVPVGSGTPAK